MKPDVFQSPDYYQIDDLLNEEHKLVREATRDWVKKAVTPIIEEHAQAATFQKKFFLDWQKLVLWSLYSRKLRWRRARLYQLWAHYARN